MNNHANPVPSSAAAPVHGAASPSLELLEARRLRDAIAALLRRERVAMADFLVALADFDRRRGWQVLGHANLFAFLLSELGLSPAPTYFRQEAARLLQRFPDLERPLREGKLCLTSMGELAKVLTEENRAEVLPRFLGISSREAKEVVAELQPRESPPHPDGGHAAGVGSQLGGGTPTARHAPLGDQRPGRQEHGPRVTLDAQTARDVPGAGWSRAGTRSTRSRPN